MLMIHSYFVMLKKSNLIFFWCFFELFEGTSDLHINWRSFLYPINVVPNMEMLNAILSCDIGALPTMYLGMPLGTKSTSINMEYCD